MDKIVEGKRRQSRIRSTCPRIKCKTWWPGITMGQVITERWPRRTMGSAIMEEAGSDRPVRTHKRRDIVSISTLHSPCEYVRREVT